jgi:hypothetical protein
MRKELTRFRQRFLDSAFWILAVECFVSAAITFGGMKLSITTNDWSWFARSGALVTALLVTISFTRMNHQFRLGLRLVKAELEYAAEHKEFDPTTLQPRPEQANITISRGLLAINEPWLLLFGTLTWGFGDLLGKVWK